MDEQITPEVPALAATVARVGGEWQIRVPRLDVTTTVRTLDEAEAAAKAVIAAQLHVRPGDVGVELTTQLPADIEDDLAEVTRWRDISGYAAQRVSMLTRRAADRLVTREKLTQREAAGLLGVSQQRVAQLLKKSPD